MIPTEIAIDSEYVADFVTIDETSAPTFTYKMILDKNRVQGWTDEAEAMKQAIFKILQTERYQYPVYSGNYGVELWSLIGQPIPFVLPEIERRITEALTWDKRIVSVTDFEFDVVKSNVHVTFIANTIYGSLLTETVVSI